MTKDITPTLRKFVAPEFIFGVGSRRLVSRYVQNLGAERVLLVSDPGVIAAGWAGDVARALEEAGVAFVSFSAISPNPREYEVMAGARIFLDEDCDAIVAVGGGSVLDCAKGIGVVVANGRHILEFEGIDNVAIPPPPLICIPTTAGTSADVSQFAIINNTQDRVKIAIISKAVVPDVALIDPETLTTMDPYLTACTGLDALVHAVEAFVSLASSPITDLHALEAIRLIRAHLPVAVTDPGNVAVRTAMMQASLHAGLAFSNASLGAVHAMAHSLGGYKDLAHGECNAILLDHVIDYNFPFSAERYRRFAEAFGIDTSGMTMEGARQRILNEIRSFKAICGVNTTMHERGVSQDDISVLAKKAFIDPCLVTNPRRPVARDIEVIYAEAL